MSALASAFSAEWLLEQEYPPLRYVVDGIVPEGFTILAAAPKVGKSWLVLGLGVAVAEGRDALGAVPTDRPRPVLYAALEDGQRRLQARLHALGVTAASSRLQFLTEAPNEGGILAALHEFAQLHFDEAPVMIVDTLGKVAPPANEGETSYDRDYRVGGALKRVADSVPGASVIAVHHSRKANAEDFLDAVSGTQGLAGSADTVLVLKRERLTQRATLSVTSRDAQEGEYALTIEGVGTWTIDGFDLARAAGTARERKLTAGVGDRMAEVIAEVGLHPDGIRPKDLAVLLPAVTNVSEYLSRAADAGRLARVKRGLYAPVSSVTSVMDGFPVSNTPHTHNRGDTRVPERVRP